MSAEERNRAEAKWLPIWLPVALCAALLLTGCYDSMETQRSPNGFEAQLIGYVDGCRVWDLQGDKAVICGRGDSASTTAATRHSQACGKGCVRTYTNTVVVAPVVEDTTGGRR